MFISNSFNVDFIQASETEILWVMRVAILLVGGASTALAISVHSIYGLWYLCSDLVYVILFPQLLCCVHIPLTNTYGSMVGFVLGLIFRFTGGEPLLSLPPAIEYPYYDAEAGYQCFPFKTLSMLISLVSILLVSALTHYLFTQNILSAKMDFAKVFWMRDEIYDTKELAVIQDGCNKNGNDNSAYHKTNVE